MLMRTQYICRTSYYETALNVAHLFIHQIACSFHKNTAAHFVGLERLESP